jgi:hypothetical protein
MSLRTGIPIREGMINLGKLAFPLIKILLSRIMSPNI